MKALVVAPEPFFSPRGTPLSVYHRTAVMAELGVEIDLLTYGQGQEVGIPGVRIVRIPAFRSLGPVPVGPSVLKAFLDLFLTARAVALLLRRRYDFVHAHEEAVFFCRWLRPLFGFRLVYDMHSSLPQQLVNFRFTRSRLLIGLFERLERSCLRSADVVITISPALAEYARGLMPSADRHVLIENSLLDEVHLTGGGGDAARAEVEDELPGDRPIVAYAGTFESYQGLDLLIAASAEVARSLADVYLLLIGGTPEQVERHREMARRHGVADRVRFTGQLPQTAARRLLRRADLLVSPRSRGVNTPLKIYEQLASGKPLVATRILAHTQVLDESVCFLAEPEPRSLAEAILAALRDGSRRRAVAEAARELYERRYSRPVYTGKVRAVLEMLA